MRSNGSGASRQAPLLPTLTSVAPQEMANGAPPEHPAQIFLDPTNSPLKFFLQKDIPEDVKATLAATIASLGGQIVPKVPIEGYILTQSDTEEEARLKNCWLVDNRPERYFVPYTYVDACRMAQSRIPQIFIQNSKPMRLHIHPSIASVNARQALAARITHSGGEVSPTEGDATVILADPTTNAFDTLATKYQGNTDKQIESHLWVKKTVEKGCIEYTPVVYKNLGGRKAGVERIPFDADDDKRLCGYIAMKIPRKEDGGRKGNKIYHELVELKDKQDYAWVTRHSWQSWRERYKMNFGRMDPIISEIVQSKNISPGKKGQHGYVRRPEEFPKVAATVRRKRRRAEQDDGELQEGDEEIKHCQLSPPAQAEMMGTIKFEPPATEAVLQSDSQESLAAVSCHNPEQNPAPTQYDEDESGWRVRIGHDAPPGWAAADERPAKRTKTSGNNGSLPESVQNCLDDIARVSRFALEEIREHYEMSRNVEKTKTRFIKMRELLQENFEDA